MSAAQPNPVYRASWHLARFLLRLLFHYRVEGAEKVPADGDLSAVKGAIRALERGMAFGIFPEGTRSRTGKLQPFKTGVAAIALRTGSPVVPVAVVGTEEAWPVGKKLFRPCRPVRVIYGDPIPVPRKSKVSHRELEALTREIEARVRDLLPPRYWGS